MRLFVYALNSLVAAILALVSVAAVALVVGDAFFDLWANDRRLVAVLALIGFPLTFLIWPWTHEVFGGVPLWTIFIAGVVSFKLASYWIEQAGPAARANLDIERSVDYEVWSDALEEMQLGIYRETTRRFRGVVVQASVDPVVPDEVLQIIENMVNVLAGPKSRDDVPGSRESLRSLARAGYLWRVAESGSTGFLDDRIRALIDEAGRSTDTREGVIALAASDLPTSIHLGYGSPGGVVEGGDFLDAGFDYARRYYAEEDTLANDTAASAFYYGVALHDVERVMAQG